jgi:hypothetical protein
MAHGLEFGCMHEYSMTSLPILIDCYQAEFVYMQSLLVELHPADLLLLCSPFDACCKSGHILCHR